MHNPDVRFELVFHDAGNQEIVRVLSRTGTIKGPTGSRLRKP